MKPITPAPHRSLLLAALLAGTSLYAQSAQAQEGTATAQQTTADDAGVEEIVVTAQRKSESIQSTPISIMAFGESALANKAISGLGDLTSQVPSLQLTPFPGNATSQRIYIRGIGSNNDQLTQDPSVAVYVDGVYMARSQGLATEVADLERIEVLRGPQGSLYGRNATGGAINFITRAPELGEWSASQTFTVSNLNGFRSRTLVNIPVGDSFAAQFSYFRAVRDGVTDNLGSGVKRFGDQDRAAYRAALLWQPIDGLELKYVYDRTDVNDTPAFAAPVPLSTDFKDRPHQGSSYVKNLQRNDVTAQGHSLTASWDISDAAQLKSITAWRRLSSFTNQDYLSGVFGPYAASFVLFDQHQSQFSQEVQLVGSIGDELEYATGLYYFSERAHSYDSAFQLGKTLTERNITVGNKAYAAYAQLTYTPQFADGRLHLTAGGRWSHDTREASLQRIVTVGSGTPTVATPGAGDRSFSDFSPSGTIAFDISPTIKTYARLSTGYKTGGFNIGASSITRFNDGFAPESVTSYELGFKSDLFGRTVRINAALFNMDYRDIQVNVNDPKTPSLIDVINAGKARIRGVELDATMRPVRALTLTFNYAYLDSKYTEILNSAGTDVTASYAYIQAPKHAFSVNLDYDLPTTPIGTPSLHVDYGYQSKQFAQANDPRYMIGQYGLLNTRLNLADIPVTRANVTLGLWARNLTNKDYYVTLANLFAPGALYGEPRTYGVDLSVKF